MMTQTIEVTKPSEEGGLCYGKNQDCAAVREVEP